MLDTTKLINDLINYYGTAIFSSSPIALMELSKIEKATEEELIQIAINNKFNLNKYIYEPKSINERKDDFNVRK